ncbi:uncharacterized protein LOC111052939 [Nilaparvata lugens]|uniref:uncharacterized protein LOC111052939 n=1 Tax=Nilaparvata lugens TaxID=108931 RepID=UPI000B99BC2D|nr:uncharacterized protein LOC111052939 [Nilaparvata lugens]XP_039286604.1 uncharacterized protein LOC111052939 [Nilaparvata lugens]
MPLRKQPLSLLDISRNCLIHQIVFECQSYCKWINLPIERIVLRGHVVCPDQLLALKKLLRDNLPNDLFDHVCNETLLSLSYKIGRTSHREYENVLKVILSLFVNTNMRIFYPKDAHGISFIWSPVPDIDSFWMGMLCTARKLVVLSLYKVCTDEILEVVGKNCLLLEVIDITSKTACFERKKKFNINALRLQYFVTDTGLVHLTKCKKLREVYMNSLSANHHARRMVTQNGILQLVRSLPHLNFISYKAMGTIVYTLNLNENAPPLSLMHIEEDNCKPEHIRAITKLCHNLKSLVLVRQRTFYFKPSCSYEVEHDIIAELSASRLQLQHLRLQYWPYMKSVIKFIKLKGHHLRTLRIIYLENSGTISSNDLNVIGQSCPNIECLHVDPVSSHDSDSINVRSTDKKHFMNLTSLYFHGINWSPEVCFVMCIRNAVKLKILYLTHDYLSPSDSVNFNNHFCNLLKINPLSELQVLNLGRGMNMSEDTVYKIIEQCTNLKSIALLRDCVHRTFESELHHYIAANNFKLSVHFDY